MDKSILITGCSSGLGYDAAHGLRNRGWRVFATCRNELDCEKLRKEGLESFKLDYDDSNSIKLAVEYVVLNFPGFLKSRGLGLIISHLQESLAFQAEEFG